MWSIKCRSHCLFNGGVHIKPGPEQRLVGWHSPAFSMILLKSVTLFVSLKSRSSASFHPYGAEFLFHPSSAAAKGPGGARSCLLISRWGQIHLHLVFSLNQLNHSEAQLENTCSEWHTDSRPGDDFLCLFRKVRSHHDALKKPWLKL